MFRSLNYFACCIMLLGCAPSGIKITAVPLDRSLKEFELQRDPGWVSAKIALIDVDGIIMNKAPERLLSEAEHPVSFLTEKLEAARRDGNVKAAVLRINSPGGSVTASEIMHAEIRRFRESGKPIVAMMMDVAASGGYYMACACDEIVAHPTSVTGSIGVVMLSVDLSSGLGKLGISVDAIKSGPNKDAGSPFRSMSAEERQIFQGIIDEMYGRFVDVVEAGRPGLSRERILELADGRIYTAAQALDAGLVDRVGSLRDAISLAKKKAGLEACRVVTYQRPMGWHPNIYASAPPGLQRPRAASVVHIDWPSWLTPGRATFMYLWMP